MSKKIIAVIAVVTIVFVSVFAACNKKDDERVYVKHDELNLVTDENGEKVLNDDGEFLVYATDEDGDRIKNDKGEYETHAQQFQPIEDDGVIEDYGFKFTLPEGWKSTNELRRFENTDKSQVVEISVVEYTYKDYYKLNKDFYEQLKGARSDAKLSWEDDVKLGEDFKGVCRFTLTTEEGTSILYFFENTDNIYKVLFNAKDGATAAADSEALLKAITFKPYTYYPDVTSATTEAK